jgi:hypothetical protein
LQAVHASLGELFGFIEEENKRLGYKYADHVAAPNYDYTNRNTHHQSKEATLRPLMNYDESPEENKTEGNHVANQIELTA